MIPWLLIAGLVTGAPTLWVEREGASVHLTSDLSELFDAELQKRLKSGLTTRLRVDLRLVDHNTGDQIGYQRRSARARWDLWDEALTVVIEAPNGSFTLPKVDVPTFIERFAKFDGRLAVTLPSNASVYHVEVELLVNPVTDDQLARMRRWLSLPGPTTNLDPLSGSLLGSFVRLFDNLKPGSAERTITRQGQAFRGDRLPFRQTP